MPITATIRAVTSVGDGCSVFVEFSDGGKQQFDFNPVPANADVRARVKAEVVRQNTIDDQVNKLQNLVGVTIS
jgi:hypothetical protein